MATAGPRCLYCGAVLPSGPAAARAEDPLPSSEPERVALLAELSGAAPAAAAAALGLPAFEAGQRVRRAGWQFLKLLPAAAAQAELGRLAALGIRGVALPEAELQPATRPLLARAGDFADGVFALASSEGALRIDARELLLVVKGPIAREYQAEPRRRRIRTATLTPGYRFHLHARSGPRPVELDPGAFEFDARGATASSLLRIASWIQALGAAVPIDEGFRFEPAALAPAATEAGGRLDGLLVRARAQQGRSAAPLVLDNLAQFRFYSAWRGAIARKAPTS